MKYLINNKDSNHLVLLLHGSETGIDSYLFKEMFEGMKDINANVAMLEFSFIENGAQADPDQVVESNEVKEFLTTQNYE